MSISISLARVAGYRALKRKEDIKIGYYKLLGLLPKNYSPPKTNYAPSLRELLIITKKYIKNWPVKNRKNIEKTIENIDETIKSLESSLLGLD